MSRQHMLLQRNCISKNLHQKSFNDLQTLTNSKSLLMFKFSGFSLLSYSISFASLLFVIVFLNQPFQAAAQPPQKENVGRCSPNITKEYRTCTNVIILPLWFPTNTSKLSTADTAGRAIVYLLSLIYLFLGVSIIADRFMSSIEVITSKKKEVVYKTKNGTPETATVRIWNETVSNLTLMALGSSAPEIMLSIIEICGRKFHAGDLGPSTIVGSASFNLFIIIAICMYVIPDGEVRKVKHPRVFIVTATWSVLAYIWLYVILAVSSPGIVEIWEGVMTFLFFPVLVVFAWIADRRLLLYKLMYKRYRARRKNIIVETEGDPQSKSNHMKNTTLRLMEVAENGRVGTEVENVHAESFLPDIENNEYVADTETNRKNILKIMKELRRNHPNADLEEIARLANEETLILRPKSRAYYRIQATRMLTGAGNIMIKEKRNFDSKVQNLEDLTDQDHEVAKVFFDPPEYKVLENCGSVELCVVRKGGELQSSLFVDYKTADGTANAGSDYVAAENTIMFRPGESVKKIRIEILDDDIFEEDEFFTVSLFNVRLGTVDGMFETNERSMQLARLECPSVAHVIILDDDHAGVFSFASSSMQVSESDGVLKVEVKRSSGARGKVFVPYKTVSGTAKGNGIDYEDVCGELEFENDETSKFVHVCLTDDEFYDKNKNFSIVLSSPRLKLYKEADNNQSSFNDCDETKLLSKEEEEERRIAELGKPRLGLHPSIEIVIKESSEFKSTVDKLFQKANLAMIVGTSSWREQFTDALSVNGGNYMNDDEKDSSPSTFDYVMHCLTVFWKILFALVPPTDYFGGWACFSFSILVIGLLTALIGDVATQFGCIVNLNDAVTAVTLVAMGTSVPDTFASKVAAIGDQYADASIGNVTGSNAVNVFLGIGIAWTVAAIYWAVTGKTPEEQKFRVPPGNLAFSVTVFFIFALIAFLVLFIRRRLPQINAELGGPRTPKIICSSIFILLWFLYILLASLDSYCVIQTF